MPLTAKGKKIKRAMRKQYGDEKGEEVFHASQNAGKIKGTHKTRSKSSPSRRRPAKRGRKAVRG